MVFLFVMILVSPALCQTGTALLDDGIKQYQNENYEEAIEILEKVRSRIRSLPWRPFFWGWRTSKPLIMTKPPSIWKML